MNKKGTHITVQPDFGMMELFSQRIWEEFLEWVWLHLSMRKLRRQILVFTEC